MDAESDSSAHCVTVHVCDVGFGIGGNQVVELVFKTKERFRNLQPFSAGKVLYDKGCNITAGAESFGWGLLWSRGLWAGTANYDGVRQLRFFPLLYNRELI